MLCERLTDPARLSDRRYMAEPKLDGQRAQLHVEEGRAVACNSRRDEDLLRHAGMTWLREIAWPFNAAVLDGEACAGDGHEGIQAVFSESRRPSGAMSLVFFDLLALDTQSVMREAWKLHRGRSRRRRRPPVDHVRDPASGRGFVVRTPSGVTPAHPAGRRHQKWLRMVRA